jgi:putative membrane-bound dehydrogenase-like protein
MITRYRLSVLLIPYFTCLFGVALFFDHDTLAVDNQYDVGVAKIDITPTYPVRLNGFGFRRLESEGVAQQIWVKALAISKGDDPPVVIFTVDNLGVRSSMVDSVAGELKKQFDIPRKNVVLTFTHTHCAPKVNGASDNIFGENIPEDHQKHIDQYTDELSAALIKVGSEAIKNRTPCTMHWSVGSVGFAANRRTAGGPTDHDLPVLVVKNENKEIIAIYTSYACHCTTLSFNQIHGDWAGCAQQTLERLYPGAIAMVAIGAGSDSNPDPRDQVEHAIDHGNQIASEIARLTKTEMTPVTGNIHAQLEFVTLPLSAHPTREQFEQTAQQQDPVGYNARVQLARLDRGEKLITELDYPIQTVTFANELAMVFLAGEVCVDYSLRLKKEIKPEHIWVHGYCNDFVGYIPSERLLGEGGYGGGSEIPYFDWPSSLKAGMEQKIIDQVKAQVPKSFHVPPGTNGVAPKSPDQSMKLMKTHKRFRVELAASEPQIQDPVAIDFGADGTLWVAEMPDYTREVDDQFKQHGRISHLRDVDNDGFFESASVFVDGLRFPTDVKVWRKGILVCDAPDILYFEDTDNDDVADVRKQLFTGFATHNPHARVNSLRIGLDQWVYGSCGLFGGEITSFNGSVTKLGARDFRCNPDTGDIEPVTGNSQQGRVRDDWDNWFGCDNSDLLRHYPWTDHQNSNPFAKSPPTAISLAVNQRLFPPRDIVTFKLSGSPGVATSACGIGVYRDTILGADLQGNVFCCEPVNQLVHRVVLEPSSATFSGHRAKEESGSEFLTSTDRWFRPVQIRTGPDGALWLVDMYRYVIEHPRWIPAESKQALDTFAGSRLGRIYRIVPNDRSLRDAVNLESLNPTQLVEQLETANGTRRDLIQQMLVWKNDDSISDLLRQLFKRSSHPKARVHAICILDALNSADQPTIKLALADTHAGVRRQAIRIASRGSIDPYMDHFLGLASDESAQVRMQLAFSLAVANNQVAAQTLAKLLGADGDQYVRAAATSSLNESNLDAVFRYFVQNYPLDANNTARLDTVATLVEMRGALGSAEQIHETLCWLLDMPGENMAQQVSMLAVLLAAADKRNNPPTVTLHETELKGISVLVQSVDRALQSSNGDQTIVMAAIRFVGRRSGPFSNQLFHDAGVARSKTATQQLAEMIGPQQPPEFQHAALNSIAVIGDPHAPGLLLQRWPNSTPVIRTAMLDCMVSRNNWLPDVLQAVEKGELNRSEFSSAHVSRLTEHSDPAIQKRAGQLFVSTISQSGQLDLKQWEPVLQIAGDAIRGQKVFNKHCAICHPTHDQSKAVGPNLKSLTQPTPRSILESIVNPNLDLQQQFVQYNALMLDGQTISGILYSETANSITLRDKEGKDHNLLRQDIDQLRATQISMMPEDLVKQLDQQQIADLISSVIQLGKGPKSLPGNQPRLIVAADDGSIVLPADSAEIFGGDITFEGAPFQNIGYWHGVNDHVSWHVQIEKPGAYDVWMEFACHASVAGNTLVIESGDAAIVHTIGGTGQWSDYQKIKLGSIELNSSTVSVTARPADDLKTEALMDLRTLLLVPEGSDPRW